MKLDFIVLLAIFGIVLCFVTAIVLLTFNKDNKSPQRILVAYFFVIGCGLTGAAMIFSNSIIYYPHFFRTPLIFAYLFPPLAYLYVRQNISNENIKAADWLNFLPALFYTIDFFPFFILPAKEKIPVIAFYLSHQNNLMAHGEGWMTAPWFHLVFRNLVSLFYGVLSVRLLLGLRKVKQKSFFSENGKTIRWLWIFAILQFLFFSPSIVLVLIDKTQYSFTVIVLPMMLMSCVTCVMLFFQPSIFYGFSGLLLPVETDKSSGYEPENNNEDNAIISRQLIQANVQLEYLSQPEVEKIKETISTFMESKKPYLLQVYSINDFARDIGVPSKKLSAYLNNSEHLNYRDFINQCRINHCVEKLTSKEWQHFTLEAISSECGFNNRNSFTTAFKKKQGITPSDFLHRLKENHSS